MRISDWSSDVCSSDLVPRFLVRKQTSASVRHVGFYKPGEFFRLCHPGTGIEGVRSRECGAYIFSALVYALCIGKIGRASCRERGDSTCQFRWWPSHPKKK